ncbi:hypothetical protein Oter_4096 [Opitutus terrae PB90-1]|uniref:Uncharacterized protein n=2 Tax=Opitutus terrae TaxID=107709 RepID=B2A034_OPITP|nr:hypothetical protein Oter_4096 [Opitutus terrae PB90-1]
MDAVEGGPLRVDARNRLAPGRFSGVTPPFGVLTNGMLLRSLSALLTCGLLSACGVAAGWAAQPAPKDAQPPAGQAKAKSDKPALAKGMTAEQVLKIAGKPDEIRPIKNPNAKAEAWIYRRVLARTSRETATHVVERPAFQGPGPSGEGVAIDPVTRQERITTYQVTWVLMIEGRMQVAKQTREVERSFD